MITGRCECAKVRYEIKGELTEFCHCHCSKCRRIHGAAFVTWGEVSRDGFTYLAGEDHLKTYSFSDRADSIFCDNCGSRLLVDFKPEADMLYIAMGTVDGDVKIDAELTVDEMEKRMIVQALEKTSGNRTKAAERLGISRRTLHRKLNEYEIK